MKMHTLIAVIALPVLIALGALQMRAKNDSPLRDLAMMATIALIATLYFAF
jgi:hypothetical protein